MLHGLEDTEHAPHVRLRHGGTGEFAIPPCLDRETRLRVLAAPDGCQHLLDVWERAEVQLEHWPVAEAAPSFHRSLLARRRSYGVGRAARRLRPALQIDAGVTVLDVLFVAAIVGVLTAVAVPQVSRTLNRSRGLAAARYLASRMAVARAQAVSRSANVALRFDSSPSGIGFAVFIDGDGNGVRTADIASGVDPVLEPFVRLNDLFPHVRIALVEDGGETDGVHVGASRLLSFTASGTATSGSVYVLGADGTQWAVRVLGTTGRTRVLRYVPASRDWVPAS